MPQSLPKSPSQRYRWPRVLRVRNSIPRARSSSAHPTRRAAVPADSGLPSAQDTALAKLGCNGAGFFAANESLKAKAGLGFSDESIIQYCLERTRGWMIAEGIFDRRLSQRAGSSEGS